MILSVVIVNFNVKFFLEQCLFSLKKAMEGSRLAQGGTEVLIIDNHSADGSVEFLEPLFPSFRFIQNKENGGFAKANNQALAMCSGEYILFLNPDTILAENSLEICISFFATQHQAGAIGVRMIDGSGNFLKESKRGFPSPRASFFRMSGLAALFPRSKNFSAYYMGHLDEEKTNPVEVLPGAFMMIKKSVLDITGGFDERFFMYGEDIDLSYRIKKAGFENCYLPETTIIHFKGESTKKDARYVKLFYKAMGQFMQKHFSEPGSLVRLLFLQAGMRIHQVKAMIALPFKKKLKSRKGTGIFIKGTDEIKTLWKEKLTVAGIPIAENEESSNEIIYCEGAGQSWRSIIADLGIHKNLHLYKFHGEGTHAAVGSYSNTGQGKVLEL
jgi:N-acetylglucosaminyl-diphospho-decaprenol L-rhamnosyltransferase